MIDERAAIAIAAARAAERAPREVVIAIASGPCRYPIFATFDRERLYWIATLRPGRLDYKPLPDGSIDWSRLDPPAPGLHSSHIVVIDPDSGAVVYDGSANDEG